MNLMGTYRATRDEGFQARVQVAMVLTALDIINADLPLGHPRGVVALDILQNPEANSSFSRFLWLAASDAAIAGSVGDGGSVEATDTDIHYVVATVWHTLFPDPA